MRNKSGRLLLLLLFMLSSCMNDDLLYNFERLRTNQTERGIFIVNEGNFMYENASLSYYNINKKEVLNNVFYNTNALPLGDVAQSMTIRDSLGYILLGNSGKIYVINVNTFEYVNKITGFTSPRYMQFINENKGYVTDLYARAVYIVDPITCTINGQIDVNNHENSFYRHSTEQMAVFNNYVFVSCWSYDNKILVINSGTDQVVDSIEVVKQPNSLIIDKYEKLWVLSDGGYYGSPYGQDTSALTRINAMTFEIEKIFRFPEIYASPVDLCTNGIGDTLYFIYGDWGGNIISNGGVYKMSVTDDALPETPVIEQRNRLFYALAVDPVNSDIYVSDAIDYLQNGYIYRFNAGGFPVDSFKAGISPGAFCFK